MWEIDHLGGDKKKEVQLSSVFDDQFLDLAVDSGAGENVVKEKMEPRTPLRYSDEQHAGVHYTTANGEIMPNSGKKVLHVVTKEGHSWAMNMQITDVNKPLMSLAKICDAGNSVIFKKDGGIIENNKSGEETKFRRESHVYRMTLKLHESGSARQG